MKREQLMTKAKSLLARGARLPQSRAARLMLVASLVVVLGGGLTGYFLLRAESLPSNAAFRYADHVVTAKELDSRIQTMRALYGVQPPDGKDTAKLDRFRRDAAKAEAVSLILDDAARNAGITIADKSARDSLTRFISQQGGGSDARQKFVQSLGSAGTSERVVLTEIKRQLAVVRLFDKVTTGISVSDREVADAFDKRKGELGTPEKRGISNIVVREKAKADAILAKLDKGASFAHLAAQHSLDGATRAKGGDLGEVSAAQLEDHYAKAAFAAPADTNFGPVRTQYGWNVGHIGKVLPPIPPTFQQIKDQLKQQIELEKALHKWRSWLTGQLRSADVEYADQYRPADPHSPPTSVPVAQNPRGRPTG